MLVFAGLALVAGSVLGKLAGGRIRDLEHVQFRGLLLALASFACMWIPFRFDLPTTSRTLIVVAGYLFAAAAIALNAARARGLLRAGFVLLAIGWVMNASVMSLNGGMPLSMSAFRASGQTAAPTPGEGGYFKLVIADEDTKLKPLGDLIPLAPFEQVLSVGDFFLLAGMAVAIAGGMRAAPSSARRATPLPSAAAA